MQIQRTSVTSVCAAFSAALFRGGAIGEGSDDADASLTPAPASRVYNLPAAKRPSGQAAKRPSGQAAKRHDVRPAPGRSAQAGSPDRLSAQI